MKTTLILVGIGVVSTMLTGLYFSKTGKVSTKAGMKKALAVNVLAMLALFATGIAADASFAAEASADAMTKVYQTQAGGLGFIGAALSTGLAAVGAGIGVGQAGAAAIGAISENENILGKTLIILGLAEGVAIYGLVISIMILQRL